VLIISFVVRAGEGGRGWSQVASGDDERTDTWFGDCLLFQWLDGGQMPLSRCHGARAVLALEIKIVVIGRWIIAPPTYASLSVADLGREDETQISVTCDSLTSGRERRHPHVERAIHTACSFVQLARALRLTLSMYFGNLS